MTDITTEKLLKKITSIYKLVVLGAKRATEINSGMPKLVESGDDSKPAIVALEEIKQGKVSLKIPGEK